MRPVTPSRQKNVDYAVSQAIKTTNAAATPGLILSYDVACQYCIHFRQRMVNGRPYLSLPDRLAIVFLIGLFHVHGHKEECLARHASTYAPGCGASSGEILESLWSILNPLSRTTRNMSMPHRDETLDAGMADNNWKKLLTMGAFFHVRHTRGF